MRFFLFLNETKFQLDIIKRSINIILLRIRALSSLFLIYQIKPILNPLNIMWIPFKIQLILRFSSKSSFSIFWFWDWFRDHNFLNNYVFNHSVLVWFLLNNFCSFVLDFVDLFPVIIATDHITLTRFLSFLIKVYNESFFLLQL